MQASTEELIKIIASYLKGSWRFNQLEFDNTGKMELLGDSGRKILFRHKQGTRTMINVSGTWPIIEGDNYYRHVSDWGVMGEGDTVPNINFSCLRKPKAIANDVQNRFIKDYDRLYELCLEAKKTVLANRDLMSHKISAMKKVINFRDDHGFSVDCPRFYISDYINSQHGTVFCRQSSCDLDLKGISYDSAIKILAILNDSTKEQ